METLARGRPGPALESRLAGGLRQLWTAVRPDCPCCLPRTFTLNSAGTRVPWRSTSSLLVQLTKSATCPVREIFLCASVSAQRSHPRLRVGPVIRELLGRDLEVLPVRLTQRTSSQLSALLACSCLRRLQRTSFRCALTHPVLPLTISLSFSRTLNAWEPAN